MKEVAEQDPQDEVMYCLECGEEIPADDTGEAPFCSPCWRRLQGVEDELV